MVRRQTRVKKRNRRQQNKTRNNRRQNKSLRRKRQSRRKFRGGLVETREQRAARERAAREAREWAARQMRVDEGRREAHDPEHLRMMNDPLPDPRQQWPQQPPQQQQ